MEKREEQETREIAYLEEEDAVWEKRKDTGYLFQISWERETARRFMLGVHMSAREWCE